MAEGSIVCVMFLHVTFTRTFRWATIYQRLAAKIKHLLKSFFCVYWLSRERGKGFAPLSTPATRIPAL